MHHANVRSLTRQASADLHQTTRVARYHRLHARALDRVDLLIEYRHRDLRILHRERPAESAARVGLFEFAELCAGPVSTPASRSLFTIEIAQAVTGVVPR